MDGSICILEYRWNKFPREFQGFKFGLPRSCVFPPHSTLFLLWFEMIHPSLIACQHDTSWSHRLSTWYILVSSPVNMIHPCLIACQHDTSLSHRLSTWYILASSSINMDSKNPFFVFKLMETWKSNLGSPFFLFYQTYWRPAPTRLAVSQFCLSSFVYCADKSRLVTVWFHICFSTRAGLTSVLDMLACSVRLSSRRSVRPFPNPVNHFPSFCSLVLPSTWTTISVRKFCYGQYFAPLKTESLYAVFFRDKVSSVIIIAHKITFWLARDWLIDWVLHHLLHVTPLTATA